MLNSFISALIALFFFGKATTETEEKTKCTSWWSVLIYGILSALVGVFFYKTYQVTTLYNILQVMPIRTCYDEKGRVPDYIEKVEFYTRFSDEATYQNPFLELTKGAKDDMYDFEKCGGAVCLVEAPTADLTQLKYNTKIPDDYIKDLNLPNETKHIYNFALIANQLPTLKPIIFTINNQVGEWVELGGSPYFLMRPGTESIRDNDRLYVRIPEDNPGNLDSDKLPEQTNVFGDGQLTYIDMAECLPDEFYAEESEGVPVVYLGSRISGSEINKLNFFTAADVSQVTYGFEVHSDLPVKEVYLHTDIPIEIAYETDSFSVGPMGFNIYGGELLRNVQKGIPFLHIKLPTLANLQLIRSLILTTILTALVSLFFMSLYYCLRRAALRYRRRHVIPVADLRQLSRGRIRVFRLVAALMLSTLIALVVWWIRLLWKGQPIAIPDGPWFGTYNLDIIVPFLLLLLGLGILTLLYRWARTPVTPRSSADPTSEDGDGNADDEEPSTIFIHDTDEEDEWRRLTEGMPDDDMIELARQEEEDAKRKASEEAEERSDVEE